MPPLLFYTVCKFIRAYIMKDLFSNIVYPAITAGLIWGGTTILDLKQKVENVNPDDIKQLTQDVQFIKGQLEILVNDSRKR